MLFYILNLLAKSLLSPYDRIFRRSISSQSYFLDILCTFSRLLSIMTFHFLYETTQLGYGKSSENKKKKS